MSKTTQTQAFRFFVRCMLSAWLLWFGMITAGCAPTTRATGGGALIITGARFDRNCSVRSALEQALSETSITATAEAKAIMTVTTAGQTQALVTPTPSMTATPTPTATATTDTGATATAKRQYHRNGHCRHPDRATVAHANALINTHCDALPQILLPPHAPRHYDCSTGEGDVDRSPDCHPLPRPTATTPPTQPPPTQPRQHSPRQHSPPPTQPPPMVCAIAVAGELSGLWKQAELGCPTGGAYIAWSSWTPYERGMMMWRSDTNHAYGFFQQRLVAGSAGCVDG